MSVFAGKAILLDIEGTTSSVTFVYDVMFPYVRKHLSAHLEQHWGGDHLVGVISQIATDAGCADSEALLGTGSEAEQRARLTEEVLRQMDADLKVTGLKSLQGDIWKAGFESGQLVAHVYDDVVPCIQQWQKAGLSVRIYSSGSIAAQKLFFGHTPQGNLLSLFDGHYDTTVGSKRAADSYRAIAIDWGLPASEILFVSDVPAELDAAQDAGLQTLLCCRDELLASPHPRCQRFDQIQVTLSD